MSYILIVMILGTQGAAAITTQEFNTMVSCTVAASKVEDMNGSYMSGSIRTICVQK
jgi:hypothetical protein